MRAKVTIRGIKRPDTIEETTMNKAIQDIYEGMRAKLNKTFMGRTYQQKDTMELDKVFTPAFCRASRGIYWRRLQTGICQPGY